jgi:hypothetical protein
MKTFFEFEVKNCTQTTSLLSTHTKRNTDAGQEARREHHVFTYCTMNKRKTSPLAEELEQEQELNRATAVEVDQG